jgi:hypothetical protein
MFFLHIDIFVCMYMYIYIIHYNSIPHVYKSHTYIHIYILWINMYASTYIYIYTCINISVSSLPWLPHSQPPPNRPAKGPDVAGQHSVGAWWLVATTDLPRHPEKYLSAAPLVLQGQLTTWKHRLCLCNLMCIHHCDNYFRASICIEVENVWNPVRS